MRRRGSAAFLLGLLLAGPSRAEAPPRSAAELMDVLMWNREPVGGPFALVDQDGRPRTDADFRGKLVLLTFGYTGCPDVCPTDLMAIARALDLLGEAGAAIQPVFVTLDPARDTPALLAEFVPSFHPRLIGLTGSEAAIRQTADAFKVFYRRAEGEDAIEHSAFVYLLDGQGRYLGFFPPGTSAERMLTIIRPHLPPPARR